MTQVFKNNAYASLAAELSAVGTLASLATGQGVRFPAPTGGDHFLATLILLDGNGAETAWEIVKCTARATDGLTIERAQEGTTARIWPAGTRIELRTTAGTLDSFTDTAQAAAAAPVQSVAGRTGAVTLANGDVGLGNVDNTSDANKPVSTAQQTALNGKANTNQTMYIGTTAVAINRTTAALALTGITSIDGAAASATTAGKATNLVGGNNTTLLGAIPYQSNTDTTTQLAPNTTATKKFLRQTGTGTNGAAPAWDTLVNGDVPSALTGKTYNGLTLTAAATGWTLAGGTTSKTLTLSNTITLAGTDGSTLNVGTGGTLGTAAFTAATAYQSAQSVTGMVKSSGTARSVATPGTDYAAPNGATTFTAAQTFSAALNTQAGLVASGSITETPVVANTTTAYTITDRSMHDLTLTGNCTFTFPAMAQGKQFTLLLKQDATGARTITWPASVRWASGTAPTITTTASKTDVISFVCDGTYWLGFVGGKNYTRA